MYSGYTIEEIEDAMIATLQADETLAAYIRTFDRLPWEILDNEEEVKKLVLRAPALLVAYAGGEDDSRVLSVVDQKGMFAVVCLARNLRSATAPLRGPLPGEKGIYDMLKEVLDCLHFSNLGLDIVFCKSTKVVPLFATKGVAAFSREFEVRWRYMQNS